LLVCSERIGQSTAHYFPLCCSGLGSKSELQDSRYEERKIIGSSIPAFPSCWTISFRRCQTRQRSGRILAHVRLSVSASRFRSQSFPVCLKLASVGRLQTPRIACRSAVEFVHAITVWCASSFPLPQIVHLSPLSRVLLCFLISVARESVATRYPKILTFGGTSDFPDQVPDGAITIWCVTATDKLIISMF
jgi:hypothetical protein